LEQFFGGQNQNFLFAKIFQTKLFFGRKQISPMHLMLPLHSRPAGNKMTKETTHNNIDANKTINFLEQMFFYGNFLWLGRQR
jgi:hypothetical protein